MLASHVKEFIETRGLISPDESVLVAVSGGTDSVALLHVLCDLRRDMGFEIEAAHLNHGIRGRAADEDAAFVQNLCRELGIVCHVGNSDAPSFARAEKLSIEEAARELRHKFLIERARACEHDKIALGHTMDDQAETVLMHLIRGAGLLGVSAMKPLVEVGATGICLIRPLLTTRRADIEEFLASREILHREDASNVDTTLTRNRIRHELMKILREKYNPRILEALGSHASLVTQAEDYLSEVASEAYQRCLRSQADENIELELTQFLSYHICVQGYILRDAYRRLCGSLKDLGFTHIASLVDLASSGQSGDSIDVASGISGWLDGQSLWLGRTSTLRSRSDASLRFSVRLEPGSEVLLTDIGIKIESSVLRGRAGSDIITKTAGGDILKSTDDRVFFDLEELEPPFVLRNLEHGDRMTLFGMEGTKKVQDVLVDRKVPRSRRNRLAAFCDRSQMLWLVGIRRSNVAPVTKDTGLVLSLGVSNL